MSHIIESTSHPSRLSRANYFTPHLALSWYHIIHSEIVSVTAAMRKNQQWNIQNTNNFPLGSGNSPSKNHTNAKGISIFDYWKNSQAHVGPTMDAVVDFVGRKELIGITQAHPVLAKFTHLKARLTSVHELREIDPRDILSPFLEIIQSGDATGPIVGAALNSLEKFIMYEIIDPKSLNLPKAISALAHAVTRCKFEATDAVSDEVVLDRILMLLRVCVLSEAGQRGLDDKGICEIIEAAFVLCFQGRLSEMLRRAASQTLELIFQALFGRLTTILEKQQPAVKTSLSEAIPSTPKSLAHDFNDEGFAPYGLPAILESLRVLTTLIDPRNPKRQNSVHRVTGLTLLLTTFEVGGLAIGTWIDLGIRADARRQPRPDSLHRINSSTDIVRIAYEASRSVINVGTGATAVDAGVNNIEPSPSLHTALPGSEKRGIMRSIATGEKSHEVYVNARAGNHDVTAFNLPCDSGTAEESPFNSDDDSMAVAVKNLIIDDLCRYLFQLLLSTNLTVSTPPSRSALTLFALALRVISSLFCACREHLRLQQEWFLGWVLQTLDTGVVGWDIGDWQIDFDESSCDSSNCAKFTAPVLPKEKSSITYLRAAAAKSVLVGEVRELLLETVIQMARQPTFFADLYVNYDGNIWSKRNLYEQMIRFFSKHAIPDATPGNSVTNSVHQALALEGLLLFIHQIVDRRYIACVLGKDDFLDDCGTRFKMELLTAESISTQRNRRRLLLNGVRRFNQRPEDGVRFFQENGFLPNATDPVAIAELLKRTPGISKKVLGDYFAKPGNLDVLKAFVKAFNFKGYRIDEAVRLMLENFRLPGEAQQIERVVDVFAETYFDCISGDPDPVIKDLSATFLLAYSIIQQNGNQHNSQVRQRMTFEEYMRQLRGLNSGEDFPQHYLRLIFEAIKSSEIVLPEEHEGDIGFSYVWKELMKNMDEMGSLIVCKTNIYDRDMIILEYGPIIAALGYALENADDDLALQRAAAGFHQLALVAAHYHLPQVYDNIIMALSRITGLVKDGGTPPPPQDIRRISNGVHKEAEVSVKVDRWAVEFGRHFRGQVAAILMFNLAADFGNCVNEGWKSIAQCLRNLFLHSLLPLPMVQVEDFIRGTIAIPRLETAINGSHLRPTQSTARRDGILSTFAQLLSLGSGSSEKDDDMQPTPEDIDAERCTLECIKSCRVEDLFADSRYLENEALISLVTTLKEASKHQKLVSISKSKESAGSNPNSPDPMKKPVMKYHEASVFFLELLINILIQNRDRLNVIWPVTIPYFKSILESRGIDPILLERTVVGMLRLATRLVHKDDMVSTVFQILELLRFIPQESIQEVIVQLMAGLLILIKTDSSIFSRNSRWDTIQPFFMVASTHPEAASYAFDAVSALFPETPDMVLTPQGFGECVDLLISFSTAAGVAYSTLNNQNISSNPRNQTLARASNSIDRVDSSSPKPLPNTLNGRRGEDSDRRSQGFQPSKGLQESVDHAIKALDKLYKLHVKIPKYVDVAQSSPERAWFEFWLPVLSGLGQQCCHPSREIRQYSMTLLQRAILSPELEIDAGTDRWIRCFDDVLFPLLDELLRPESAHLDISVVDETRIRASPLLCKIFLHSLSRMSSSKLLQGLWTRLLQYLGRFATSGSDHLREGVLESLKNMLLVLSTQGVFQTTPLDSTIDTGNQPESTTKSAGPILWKVTWEIIGTFEPDLKNELFPSLPELMTHQNAGESAPSPKQQVKQQQDFSNNLNNAGRSTSTSSISTNASMV